jgi:hypothetical protein
VQLAAFVPFAAHLAAQGVRLVFVGSGTPAQACFRPYFNIESGY